MKKKLYVIITGIIIFICYFSVESLAEGITELREQRKLVQEQISGNTVQLDALQLEISDLMEQIQALSDDIYKYEVEVAVLDREIAELDAKTNEVEAQLKDVEKKYNRQKQILADRIIAQYEDGDVVYLDFLLNSKGLIDFISNYYIIGEIIEIDTELIKDYEKQKTQVEQIKTELDEYKAELKSRKDEQEKSAIVLSNVKVVKNNQMSRMTEQERKLQEQIDEYQKQVQEIEIELLMILTQNLDSDYVGGALTWPVPGYTTITSYYGMRIHPITGIYKLHTGVDLGAPLGSYFVAANDGTVVTSMYSASYGNMVVIDHGGGLSTLYAHGKERLVEVGDTVKRGQPVMTVGSTGISTGPHAHFEVRVNGRWVDPLDYILKNNNTSQTEEE